MKKFIFSGLGAFLLILVVAAAVSPSKQALLPYEREQIKGDVRVVLLKVERATVLTSKNIIDPIPGKTYPVPMIGVTFLIEALGKEPIKHWNVDHTEIKIGNTLVEGEGKLPENISVSGFLTFRQASTAAEDAAEELPQVSDQKRFEIVHESVRVGRNLSEPMSLTINAGFGDQKHTFTFYNLPLN